MVRGVITSPRSTGFNFGDEPYKLLAVIEKHYELHTAQNDKDQWGTNHRICPLH
mgnify:CR=1 FL=1